MFSYSSWPVLPPGANPYPALCSPDYPPLPRKESIEIPLYRLAARICIRAAIRFTPEHLYYTS